jgi:cytochrome c553
MRTPRLVPLLLTVAISATSGAAAQADDFGYCLVCHGSDAAGNVAIAAPNLTILSEDYLRAQLEGFQLGYRGQAADDHAGHSMASAARALRGPDAVDAAVAFITQYPPVLAASTLQGDTERGAALYASCATCHGAAGEGSESLGAPALAGQNDWYLLKQLNDYRSGARGAAPGDRQGTIMRSASSLIADDAMAADLVAYIASLAEPAKESPEPEENNDMQLKPAAAALAGAALLTSAALAHDVTRYPLPNNSSFPIAEAVTVPAGMELTFHSGLLPAPANPEADPTSREYLGDTYTQTMSIMERLQNSLRQKGMGLGNIVKMNVFMVGDPELDGAMDFAGFMRAYSQFFGTEEQPMLPARAAVQVAGLARGALIEIEVILAR